MNHDLDYDRDGDRSDAMSTTDFAEVLEDSLQLENELMRRYLITAERLPSHDKRAYWLRNFAEGNAKRTRQIQNELSQIEE